MDIHTDDIRLRPWKEEDAERLAEIANNKKLFDNLRDTLPYPYSLEDAKEFISSVQTDDGCSRVFAIELGGEVVGSIGAFLKSDVYRKNAEIGYFLAEEHWGKGIMTQSIRALVRYIFANTDVIRVYAEPFARNIGSRRALEKAGFRLEAILKSSVIKNNIIEDSCIYAVLKDEFERKMKDA